MQATKTARGVRLNYGTFSSQHVSLQVFGGDAGGRVPRLHDFTAKYPRKDVRLSSL